MCNFFLIFLVFYVTTGTGFATRFLSLGDLIVSEATDFEVIWRTHSGGPDNLGATFFEPSITDDAAQGYKVLGYYCQPNNKPFTGRSVLAFDKYLRGNVKAPWITIMCGAACIHQISIKMGLAISGGQNAQMVTKP